MPTTPPQLIQQATRHAAHLERLKSGYVKDLLPLLDSMQSNIIGRLASQDITAWTTRRLTKQLTAIGGLMERAYQGNIKDKWREQLLELADYEAGFESRSLNEIAVNYDFDLPSETQLKSAVFTEPLHVAGPDGGKLLESFYADWTDNQIKKTTGIIRLGFAQGKTTSQVVRDIRDFGGLADQSRRSLETVARTSLQHAANQARQQTWAANSDIIKKVRWVSTLDTRTSTICQSLDGTEYPIDSGPRPPIHPSCRSTTVAVLDDRFKVLEEGATRRDRDPVTGKVGSAPAKQTYYSWLKGQPQDVQESIIGKTRAKLLTDGGLSSERFAELQLGKNFEPLKTITRGGKTITPIEQMRELEPVAFSRAGLN